ncbi:MAG: hypothetical protein L0027_05375 [Candidatus Rokubacteria bacterium]|nr:hypothetical protein [Candidatus Rokubacteria bacterium]
MPQIGERGWAFGWEAPAGARAVERYHLLVQGARGSLPVADVTTSGTTWSLPARSPCSYVTDQNRRGWRWRVRALWADGTWSDWSEGRFDVAPVDREGLCARCPTASICGG